MSVLFFPAAGFQAASELLIRVLDDDSWGRDGPSYYPGTCPAGSDGISKIRVPRGSAMAAPVGVAYRKWEEKKTIFLEEIAGLEEQFKTTKERINQTRPPNRWKATKS